MQTSGHSLRSVLNRETLHATNVFAILLKRFQWCKEQEPITVPLLLVHHRAQHKIALTVIIQFGLLLLQFLLSVQLVQIVQISAALNKLIVLQMTLAIRFTIQTIVLCRAYLYILAQIAADVTMLTLPVRLPLATLVTRLALLLVIASKESSGKSLALWLHLLCELRPFLNLCIQWSDVKF